ncbi:MAG: PIN domain-containing protein [Gammaproteobacteria bacterium]|nr:PIN domain-containing protein [Gammaproteobacteria bacterium]
MKNKFKGFYSHSNSEFSEIWKNAVIVFDANVLLNLYRYQVSTTEQLLNVIESVKDRIWIPYHVALEYQRNRLKVIAEQNEKFSEVKNIVSKGVSSLRKELDSLNLKKRHSTIEPEKFLIEIDSAATQFKKELDLLEKQHYSVMNDDPVRSKLDELLNNRVGSKPANQDEIDKLEKKASVRFDKKIPPGYMDSNKNNTNIPVFTYDGISYQRLYSDYIVWSQIIDYAKKTDIKNIIFVTDDSKEDWWLKIKQNSLKTISPRPELVSEISIRSNVDNFLMYSSEGFLKYANDLLSVGVSDDAIEDVRDVVLSRQEERLNAQLMRNIGINTEKEVYKWLKRKYDEVDFVLHSSVDIVAVHENIKIAFDVTVIREPRHVVESVKYSMNEALNYANKNDISELVLVLVMANENACDDIRGMDFSSLIDWIPVKIILATAKFDKETGAVTEFHPYDKFEI